jgi:hypothetical protein
LSTQIGLGGILTGAICYLIFLFSLNRVNCSMHVCGIYLLFMNYLVTVFVNGGFSTWVQQYSSYSIVLGKVLVQHWVYWASIHSSVALVTLVFLSYSDSTVIILNLSRILKKSLLILLQVNRVIWLLHVVYPNTH